MQMAGTFAADVSDPSIATSVIEAAPAAAAGESADPAMLATPTGGFEEYDGIAFAGPIVGPATDPQRYLVFDVLGMQIGRAHV